MKLNSIEANAHYDMAHGMPAILEEDNDGSSIYRFNIEPEMGIPDGQEQEVQVGWKCCEIRTFNKPNKANLKKVIIRSVLDETAEFDLVNSYNKHVLGVAPDDKAVAEYKEYLQFTEDLDVLLVNTLSN
ncbi:MAG: hypothetical protein MR982_03590 [Bacteroides pyogenes]|uniref:hypothetical protein n=1 Tax=Bacteroides pyogenes TaxID=310300 RepID=UPI00242F2E57|nr:hypothetical protein [Bacteroides pyogenes]MCI7070052.1 hypothetical protein [Bacteroides pyogenes]